MGQTSFVKNPPPPVDETKALKGTLWILMRKYGAMKLYEALLEVVEEDNQRLGLTDGR